MLTLRNRQQCRNKNVWQIESTNFNAALVRRGLNVLTKNTKTSVRSSLFMKSELKKLSVSLCDYVIAPLPTSDNT